MEKYTLYKFCCCALARLTLNKNKEYIVMSNKTMEDCVYGDFFKVGKKWLCTCKSGLVALHWRKALLKRVCSECDLDIEYILAKASKL